MSELKPCPFCGETQDFGIGRGTPDREGTPTWLYCATCGAQSPWIYTSDKALWTCTSLCAEKTAWNTRQSPEWISVEDEPMPINGKEFFVLNANQGNVVSIIRWGTLHCRWLSKGDILLSNQNTHWMPLPEPPKENEDE